MTRLQKQTSRTRRAAAIGLLVAVPVLPLAGCGEGEGGDEVETGEVGEVGEEEDDGLY